MQDAKNALSQISNVSGSFNEEIKKINGILDTINGPEHQNEVKSIQDSMNTASEKLASASKKRQTSE